MLIKRSVIALILVFFCYTQGSCEEIADIQYVSSDTSIKGILTPDPSPGQVPTQNRSYVSLEIDGSPKNFNLSRSGGGAAKVSGTLGALKEDRHTATLTTKTPDNQEKDSKNILFIYDTTPPTIELKYPASSSFPRTSPMFFKFFYSDDASGVDERKDSGSVVVKINNRVVDYNIHPISGNKGEITFSLEGDDLVSNWNILLQVKDRAGNSQQFSKNGVTTTTPGRWVEKCDFPIRTKGEISYNWQFPKSLFKGEKGSFFLYFSVDTRDFPSEKHIVNKEIWKKISLTSSDPRISIRKKYLKSCSETSCPVSEDYLAGKFEISSQQEPGDQATLFLTLPFEYKLKIVCVSHRGYRLNKVTEVSLKSRIVKKPFSTAGTLKKVYHEVASQDNKVVANVFSLPPPLKSLNSILSWFEVDGQKHWFDKNWISVVPVDEGLHDIRIVLTTIYKWNLGTGGWTYSDDLKTISGKGKIWSVQEPPQIENFTYHKNSQQLTAAIQDQGTPLEQLDISLKNQSGQPIYFQFDAKTGGLTAPYYAYNTVETVTLTVTDKAEQQAIATTKVFGRLGDDNDNTFISGDNSSSYRIFPPHRNNSFWKERIERLPKAADEPQQTKSYRSNDTCYGDSTRRFTRNLGYQNGGYLLSECTQEIRCEPDTSYNEHVEEANRETLAILGARDWIEAAEICPSGRFRKGLTSFPCPPRPLLLRNTSRIYPPQCETIWRDVDAPLIYNVRYNVDTGNLSANIHDHGAPLAGIRTSLTVSKLDLPRYVQSFLYLPGPSKTIFQQNFNSFTGIFQGTYKNTDYELAVLRLTARDQAGNESSVDIDIKTPLRPPQVDLSVVEIEKTGHILSFMGQEISAHLLGTASDESGFEHDKTIFTIDEQSLALPENISHWYQKGYYDFTAHEIKLHYGKKLEEGPHKAFFKVTDNVGLSSETSLDFNLAFKPEIFNFKSLANSVREENTPLFSAFVIDRGENLDQAGMQFFVDNKEISKEKIQYNAISGYFTVSGPLDLSTGRHLAQIKAVDQDGNMAEDMLKFFVGEKQTVSNIRQLAVDVESYLLWEIADHNNDGQANPGETIRLFPALINRTMLPYADCSAVLRSEDNRINVTGNTAEYASLAANRSTMPLRGFEMSVDTDILTTTIDDPYMVGMSLNLRCENAEDIELPFTLPVYQPRIPADFSSTVTVKLDRQKAETKQKEITLTGTAESSHSSISSLKFLVNGKEVSSQPSLFDKDTGRFEIELSLEPGTNIITVEATDDSGAFGQDQLFLRFDSSLLVTLDRLPRLTSEDQLAVKGRAESPGSAIERVEVYNNGVRYQADYTPSTKRFTVDIPLAAGSNIIRAVATDREGLTGSATETVEKEGVFTPPSIQLTPQFWYDPSRLGSNYCEDMPFAGVFNPGSSASYTVNVSFLDGLGSCEQTSVTNGEFHFLCTISMWDSGFHTVEAKITTAEGAVATDSIDLEVNDAFCRNPW